MQNQENQSQEVQVPLWEWQAGLPGPQGGIRRDSATGREGQGNSGVSTAPDKEEYAVLPWTGGLLLCSHPSIQYQSCTIDRPHAEETTRQKQVDTRQNSTRYSKTSEHHRVSSVATPDLEQPYHLYTYASGVGLGAVLKQEQGGEMKTLEGRGALLQCYRA